MLCSPKAPFQGDSTIIFYLAATQGVEASPVQGPGHFPGNKGLPPCHSVHTGT